MPVDEQKIISIEEYIQPYLDKYQELGLTKGKWVVYLLRSMSSRKTYCGMTNFCTRRLRQHNRVLKGGAKCTRMCLPWVPAFIISGFPDKITALQWEWSLKHQKVKRGGFRYRVRSLQSLLYQEKATANAVRSNTLNLTLYKFKKFHVCVPKNVKIENVIL